MKRMIAVALIAMLLLPGVTSAGSSTDAALGLGAFAVLGTLLLGAAVLGQQAVAPPPPDVYAPSSVYAPAPPPVVYAPAPPVVYAPPPPPFYAPAPLYAPAPVYAPAPAYGYDYGYGFGRGGYGYRYPHHGNWRPY